MLGSSQVSIKSSKSHGLSPVQRLPTVSPCGVPFHFILFMETFLNNKRVSIQQLIYLQIKMLPTHLTKVSVSV